MKGLYTGILIVLDLHSPAYSAWPVQVWFSDILYLGQMDSFLHTEGTHATTVGFFFNPSIFNSVPTSLQLQTINAKTMQG